MSFRHSYYNTYSFGSQPLFKKIFWLEVDKIMENKLHYIEFLS